MKSPQTLRRPSNWQDFESLCKKLWGEIWHCKEIQKNGRLGQEQSGVDIFGIPKGEKEYYGIQCKGKSEYSNNHFTEKEIEKEIEKAKLFEPKLKKLYLATTALNDSKIQTFVRKKNIENIKNGYFEIHLYCWEEIVDLIDENIRTYDWYQNGQNYNQERNVEVLFSNKSNELKITPKFQKITIKYKREERNNNPRNRSNILDLYSGIGESLKSNLSFCKVELIIKNLGNQPIEDYKLILTFENDISLSNTNSLDNVSKSINSITNNYRVEEDMIIFRQRKILVSEDILKCDPFFIKPLSDKKTTEIKWKLISRNYQNNGCLKISIYSDIENIEKTYETNDYSLVGSVLEKGIKDYLK